MAKKTTDPKKLMQEINELLGRATDIVKEKKKEVRLQVGCKNHPTIIIYRSGECKSCYEISHNLRNKKNAEKEPWISTDGKKKIYREDGTVADYHRFVVEQSLGRKLKREETVKFADGDKLNCSLSNLRLVCDTGVDLSTIICNSCGSLATQ